MRVPSRVGAGTLSMAVVILAVVLPLGAQEPKRDGNPPSEPSKKRTYDPSRRVPAYFGEIGLTQEQRESIYKIRAKHQQKIEDMEKQIAQVKAQMLTDCEGVLTDTQKQLLQHRRRAALEPKKPSDTTKTAK